MRSSSLCLCMIRQWVTAVMICSLTVIGPVSSPTPVSAPAPPVGRQMKRVTHQGCVSLCFSVRGSLVNWWRKRGYWYILHWKVSLPGRACVCLCVCFCGHKALGMLRWQMALLHCWASLANRTRTGRWWEIRRRRGVSQTPGWVSMAIEIKSMRGGVSGWENRSY